MLGLTFLEVYNSAFKRTKHGEKFKNYQKSEENNLSINQLSEVTPFEEFQSSELTPRAAKRYDFKFTLEQIPELKVKSRNEAVDISLKAKRTTNHFFFFIIAQFLELFLVSIDTLFWNKIKNISVGTQ